MKLDKSVIAIGLIILVAAVFFVPQLLGDTDTEPEVDNTSPSSDTTTDSNIQFGSPIAASSVDRDGCPVNPTTQFSPLDKIYVVAPDSTVESGTTVFVRLYHEGEALEDAPEIEAQEDYDNTCINFVFEPTSGSSFETGDYEAEFYINGNAAESVTFRVQ